MAVAIIKLSLSSLVIYVTEEEYVATFKPVLNLNFSLLTIYPEKGTMSPIIRLFVRQNYQRIALSESCSRRIEI